MQYNLITNTKTLFINGTNSGFGKATVELFADQGWNVAATVKNLKDHPTLFSNLINVKLYALNVDEYEEIGMVAQEVIADFKRIDVLVNNAGFCVMGPTETTTMEQIEKQFQTNVFGVFAVMKAFIPHFRENKSGKFINISSSSGQFNYPFIAAYGSSKWAVRGLGESLGIELKPFNIEVKTIYPGTHSTKIFTKLDQGASPTHPSYKFYKRFYSIFVDAQKKVPEVNPPIHIAQKIWEAAVNPKGKLQIIAGGDAKFFAFVKKILPARTFQKLQLLSMTKPISKMQIGFMKMLFGSRTNHLEFEIPKELTEN